MISKSRLLYLSSVIIVFFLSYQNIALPSDFHSTNAQFHPVYQRIEEANGHHISDIAAFFQQIKGNQTSNSKAATPDDIHWIEEYLIWHYKMRHHFPDSQIIENSSAPNITIAWCEAEQFGGLNDRMKFLSSLLWHSYVNKRVLFLKWYQAPVDLEEFLIPHLLNFTLFDHETTRTSELLTQHYDQPNTTLYPKILLRRLKKEPKSRRRINVSSYFPPFHVVWHAVFRPSAAVQNAISQTMHDLNLRPNHYDAVHCRVTHPAFLNLLSQNETMQDNDLAGIYSFEGSSKIKALQTGIHGIHCVNDAVQQRTSSNFSKPAYPIYFYSDSHILVKAMIDPESELASDELNATKNVKNQLLQIHRTTPIVGRSDAKTTHISNQNVSIGLDAFISTFVDLYVASMARCLSIGVGNFGYLANLISWNDCGIRYQNPRHRVRKKWGISNSIPLCSIAEV